MKEIKTVPPPKKLSEAIRMAMRDFKRAQDDKNLCVDMSNWHGKYDDGLCHVCFAGALIHYELDIDADYECEPRDFYNNDDGINWANVMIALDSARKGLIDNALGNFRVDIPDGITFNEKFVSFLHYPETFDSDMECIATRLELYGF